ncbi:hypothetical protein [Culicoidibacter larvae]|uniref:Uncharacterized protein n=1 Tax=Culicoidibacter larvae TaxID=2579976 RepID=A0A5R8QA39_9FIRM|nr:hypothetical protein [Culicoidibacter larvae]TLG72727.1 hypothetical protein FEZ08_08475 [Culicoidibacter larvae]
MSRIGIVLVAVLLLLLPSVSASAQAPDTVNADDLSEYRAGTYPVQIKYYDEASGQTLEKIVYMTVYYPNTITDADSNEGIDAMDVLLDADVVKGLSQQELIAKAQAKAWRLSDGSAVEITEAIVEYVGGSADSGQYSVTFRTAAGTTNTVTFLEAPHSQILVQNETYIADSLSMSNQVMDWVYLAVFVFVFIPIVLIVAALVRMMVLVRKTKRLLYTEYNREI